MQVQNITNSQLNSQNFQGRIDIIPGDLSYEPAKYVRKAYNAMENLIKDKPYNIYIRQNHKQNNVSLIVQREDHIIKNKGIKAEGTVSKNADLYESLAEHLIGVYDQKVKNQPMTLGQKIKNGLKKIGHKLLKTFEIEE